MSFVLKHNNDTNEHTSSHVRMNLRGAAIAGNGRMDPYHKYAAVAEIAYSIGMINASQKEGLDRKEKVCQRDLKSNRQLKSDVCFDLLDDDIIHLAKAKGVSFFQEKLLINLSKLSTNKVRVHLYHLVLSQFHSNTFTSIINSCFRKRDEIE